MKPGVAVLLVCLVGCTNELILIEGSSCKTTAECDVHPSCQRHEKACSCRNGQCYFDPDAPLADPNDSGGCRTCHGSNRNSAPPFALGASHETDTLAVGAHQAHITGGKHSRAVGCRECHRVPDTIDSPGHIDTDLPAEITWGELSTTGGATPVWDVATVTCTTTYCHGATLEGPVAGLVTNPEWTDVDGALARCGSCHGLPPDLPHPSSADCEMCHLPTSGPNLTIAHRNTHIDGVVQASLDDCTGCHGNQNNLAPPVDMGGNADTSVRSVGAHQAHMTGGRFSRPVACTSCHRVPFEIADPGHDDTPLPAEVIFHSMALLDGATPAWNEGAETCANTYCHGATMDGGTNTRPTWTRVDGTEAACGTCHGMPPAAPHPASDACGLCHAPTAGPGQTIADPTTHIDGTVQASDGTCADCHGNGSVSSPPANVDGDTDTTVVSVGAHASHVHAVSGISRPVPCDECHIVPQATDDPGHIDTPAPAEVVWGTLAATDSTQPEWDDTAAQCTNTYCHGATLTDGSNTEPVWNAVDGTQAACGTCHGMPPAGTHPTDDRCELCHLPTAGPGQTIADPTTHIDGVMQAAADCDTCHGENGDSAPPPDTSGRRNTTNTSVGAHATHRSGGLSSHPVACNQCHIVPTDAADPGHDDTPLPAEVIFGAIAAQGTTPVWQEPRCQNTWCHTRAGGTTPNPEWTVVDSTQAACDGCHGLPPNDANHGGGSATQCTDCHLPTAGPNQTVANRATHVDGIIQASDVDCSSCHGDDTGPEPPVDLDDPPDTDPTDPEVGAHVAHLHGGTFSIAVACNECHRVPINNDDPGHTDTNRPAEVSFSGRAISSFGAPVWDDTTLTCANVYCHGADSSLGTEPEPVWNAPASIACGSCHGLPPAAPHPQHDLCELCHPMTAGPGQTLVSLANHINGVVELDDQMPCETCHGSATNAAPPADLDGNNNSAYVGAHQAHLVGTGNARPVTCNQCHIMVNPATPDQAGHWDTVRPAEITWGPLARQGGLTPGWSNPTCSGTYCHGATLTDGNDTTPDWSGGPAACDDCHGMPPVDARHQNGAATQCEQCHPDTAGSGQTIVDADLHVDGVVQFSANCDSCHGGGGESAPPVDTRGNSSSDEVGVHQAHMHPSDGADVACADCHRVPNDYADAGHDDTPLPAEVLFAGTARVDGANPTYNSPRCSNTYCHGTTLAGGTTNVDWNDTDGSEAQCGACHGMPPNTAGHQDPPCPAPCDACELCHVDSVGPGQNIIDRSLHVDGVLQVSGGGCSSCHESPPTPATEDYTDGGGAHAAHTAAGIECVICHGNNGSGPDHNPNAVNTPSRTEVDIVFDNGVSFPGGTSMQNGGTASYNLSQQRCTVGCHNPRPGNPPESANLNNTVTWTASPPGCTGCHDRVEDSAPRNHDIAGLGDAGCLECHSATGHTSGTAEIADPDPGDSFAYTPGNINGLCKTCHDGSGPFFGGQTARDATAYWTASGHGSAGYDCSDCHTYHGSTGGPVLFDTSAAACLASGCHNDMQATFNLAPGGVSSHHHVDDSSKFPLGCSHCHNAHKDSAPPNATVYPTNRWTTFPMPGSNRPGGVPPPDARTSRSNRTTYNAYCVNGCHVSNPSTGVSGAKTPSQASWSRHTSGDHGGRYTCQNCHDWHGSSGTSPVQRGRMIVNFGVNSFPYGGESTCGARGTPSGMSFSCH